MTQVLRLVVVVGALVPALAGAAPQAARKPRIAVMEMRPLGTEAVKAELLSEVALTEASHVAGLEVIGRSDIAGIIGFEKEKAMLGCGEELACIGEVSGALGVDYLLLGSLGRLGTLYRVDLKLVDARKARVLARAGESVSGEEEKLVATVQRAVRELLAPIAPGRDPGAEAAAPAPAAKAPAAVAAASPFDGGWHVNIACPEVKTAKGYTIDMDGAITGGTLLATHGAPGTPGSLRLEGPVSPDGSARLKVTGFTGRPEYAVVGSPAGTPLRYGVRARFERDRGTGSRIEHRPCVFTFTRR
jgi:TolB-like protein